MRVCSKFAPSLLSVVLLAGCAAGRSVVPAGIDAGENPAEGRVVRIEQVVDARSFTAAPPSPEMPSLMNADEIGNSSITARAIGRKRGGFGNALGDVLLPEGQSVSQLVESAVARALRESGYRVVGAGDPGHAQALPVNVRVDKFWSWFTPGFASVTLECQADVFLSGQIAPLTAGRAVTAAGEKHMQAVFEDDWRQIVNVCLQQLATAVKTALH